MSQSIRYVVGQSEGRDAWWYLQIDKIKMPLYQKVLETRKSVVFTQFGKILKSGWGKAPPEAIKKEMAEKYSIFLD